MDNDSRQSRSGAVGEALAAFHDRLAAGDAMPSPSAVGLDADEMAHVVQMQECLVPLERLRADESADRPSELGNGSTANVPRGSTFPSHRRENESPDASVGAAEEGERAATADLIVPDATGPGRIGRFEIVRVLGRGGQGLMLLAHDPVLARHVALKVPWSETLITPQLRRRFLREARAVARLTHPHIVAVYDVGEVGPICFIASAFVEGQSLAARLKGGAAPISPRVAATIVADLADAMHYAHGQGVLHRDLKPGNVLLESPVTRLRPDSADQPPWIAKITDFGLAKILDQVGDETRSGAIIGTLAYISPEQAKAEHGAIGPATDIYAFGAILYELLTGRPPFRAGSDAETLRLIASEEPTAPRRVNPTCPHDLEAISLKCLEKGPSRRYRSAGELAADLRRYLAGEPIQARSLSAHQKLLRWARRQPMVAGLSVGILLLLLTIATVATIAAVRINQSRREIQATAERETAANSEATRLRLESENSLHEVEHRGRQMWRAVYAANSRRAFEAYADGNIDLVRRILQENVPGPEREDLRGFEWHYSQRALSDPESISLPAAGGACYFVTYSPDGRLLLAGTKEGMVTVWDSSSFAKLASWQAHDSCVNDIRFSPDGQLIATTSCDHTARLWHTNWQPASEPLRHGQAIFRSAFTSDGKTLITGSDPRATPGNPPAEITFWDIATARPRQTIESAHGMITDLCLGLGGSRLLTINQDHTIQQWQLDGEVVTEIKHDLTPVPHNTLLAALAVAPDQKTLVYTSALAGIEVADIESNSRRDWNRPGLQGACFAISHDGRFLAHGDRNSMVWIRELSDGSLVEALRHVGNAHELCFSPNNQQLVAARQDGGVCVTTLLAANRSERRCTLNESKWDRHGAPSEFQLDPTATQLWHREQNNLVKLDLASGESRTIFPEFMSEGISYWCIAPDGSAAIVTTTAERADEHYYLIRGEQSDARGQVVAEFDSELIPQFDSGSARVAGYAAGHLWVRDARSGQVLNDIAVPVGTGMPNDRKAHYRGQVCWFAAGSAIIAPLYPECVRCDLDAERWTALGPAADHVLSVEGGPYVLKRDSIDATVVDGSTGDVIAEVELGHGGCWDLSPDGRRLLAIENDHARLYDVATGHDLGVVFHPEVPLSSGRFSANGQVLVFTSSATPKDRAFAFSLSADAPEATSQSR